MTVESRRDRDAAKDEADDDSGFRLIGLRKEGRGNEGVVVESEVAVVVVVVVVVPATAGCEVATGVEIDLKELRLLVTLCPVGRGEG